MRSTDITQVFAEISLGHTGHQTSLILINTCAFETGMFVKTAKEFLLLYELDVPRKSSINQSQNAYVLLKKGFNSQNKQAGIS